VKHRSTEARARRVVVSYGERMVAGDLVVWAREVAEAYVAPLGRRWTHVQRVAARAEQVAALVPAQRDTLITAAWLHDVGYAPALAHAGFHPLDGGRYVRGQGQEDVARLVAHHTGARVEATIRGIDGYLDEFPFDDSDLDRALTFCDLTTGPGGAPVRVADRVQEIQGRYGPDHPVSRCMQLCVADFLVIEEELEQRLAALGKTAEAAGALEVGGSA
jgi:hypothetical protein